MGQLINVDHRVQGDVAVFTGDRSLTGQDGARYFASDNLPENGSFTATLAGRFFELDPAIDYVFIAHNHVVARRPGGWDQKALDDASDTLHRFFVFWDGDRHVAGPDGGGVAEAIAVEGVVAEPASAVDTDEEEGPIGGIGAGVAVVEHIPEADIPLDEMEALRTEHYNATISYIDEAHSDLWMFGVEPDDGPLQYQAGQYTTLALGFWEPRLDDLSEDLDAEQRRKLARRSYSVSSPLLDANDELVDPEKETAAEFYVVLVRTDWQGTPAVLTPRLFLKGVGDRLFIGRKAAGRYRLDKLDDPTGDIVFLSTGTGEAPNNRMTLDLLRGGHQGKIVGVCTTRYRRDLAYLEKHQKLEAMFDNYSYVPLTTREPENEGNKVYIQDLVESGKLEEMSGLTLDPDRTHFYLCGNPLMIGLPEYEDDVPVYPETRGVVEILVEKGFTLDHGREVGNIHYEEYW